MASSSSPALINNGQSPPDPDQQPYSHQIALLNLIKKPTRFKPLADHRPSIISFSDSNDSKIQSPTDNLILDGFLKNNGGYLDDSDLSDSEDSEDNPPSDINHNKHTIHVLAKKYQHEVDSNDSTYNPLIRFTLSKKIFNFNLNHSDHHYQRISTIIHKQPDNQNLPKTNPARELIGITSLANNHHPNYHQNDSTQILKHQQRKQHHVKDSPPIQFIRNQKNNHVQMNSPKKLTKPGPSSNHHHRNSYYHHIDREQSKDEDWNLNFQYIQSSAFPTSNAIMNHDHSQRDHPHHAYLYTDHDQSFMVSSNNNLHLKKLKSPFRNLVLGEDDLLRLN